MRYHERRKSGVLQRPLMTGYETYSFGPTDLNGHSRCGQIGSLPGEMKPHTPRPGKLRVTSKSKSVGYSWDLTDRRAIFGRPLIESHNPLSVHVLG